MANIFISWIFRVFYFIMRIKNWVKLKQMFNNSELAELFANLELCFTKILFLTLNKYREKNLIKFHTFLLFSLSSFISNSVHNFCTKLFISGSEIYRNYFLTFNLDISNSWALLNLRIPQFYPMNVRPYIYWFYPSWYIAEELNQSVSKGIEFLPQTQIFWSQYLCNLMMQTFDYFIYTY